MTARDTARAALKSLLADEERDSFLGKAAIAFADATYALAISDKAIPARWGEARNCFAHIPIEAVPMVQREQYASLLNQNVTDAASYVRATDGLFMMSDAADEAFFKQDLGQ